MRTFIFILALSAVALPALAATTTNPINCDGAGTAKFCNKCLATDDAQPAATDQCFDCMAGYYLTFTGTGNNGVCTRCDAGTGIAAGNGSTRPAQTQSSASCTACHETCALCFAPNSAASCSKCALDTYTTAAAVGGAAACSGTCTAGMTRATGGSEFTATQAAEGSTVCNQNCDATCASCRGVAGTACTKCAIGKYATGWNANTKTATCSSSCDAGTTRDVAAGVLTDNENKATICVACNTACAECKGTASTACTKCAAGYYLSAAASANGLGTCSACDEGKGKNADTTAFTANNQAAVKDNVCKACTSTSNCGICSEATPAACITCPSGKTIQTDKTCNAPTNGGTNGGSTNGGTNGGTTGGSTTNTTGTTNTTNTTQGASASTLQVVCGAFLAAYALF